MVNHNTVLNDIEEYAGLAPMTLKGSAANHLTTSAEQFAHLNQTEVFTALTSIGIVTDPHAPVSFGILAETRSIICQASVGAYHQLAALIRLHLADYFNGCDESVKHKYAGGPPL